MQSVSARPRRAARPPGQVGLVRILSLVDLDAAQATRLGHGLRSASVVVTTEPVR